ncbi:hypothetical protein [Clostridium lacusfryxellense]|uniref:hypothetical protein n=1 Tax=Clostridium lacusfryxellense TaxID=205328 RepID=UPI001C0A94E7|nr:hypothetical protein [Clostridium lacusfryxellense]MBU3111981.1 hypothetical protein [Clostridium lacusfryxellense]
MIKSKEDARLYLIDCMGGTENAKWEGKYYTLNEVQQENTYRWNAGGARIFDENNQITFEILIDATYKNRKVINNYHKNFKKWLNGVA